MGNECRGWEKPTRPISPMNNIKKKNYIYIFKIGMVFGMWKQKVEVFMEFGG